MNTRRSTFGLPGTALLCLLIPILLVSCKEKPGAAPAPVGGKEAGGVPPARGDALFLADAPALVPDEVEPDLDTMAVSELFVAAASLSSSGKITALPPPPNPIKRPVILTVMGEPGAEGQLGGAKGEIVGEAWGTGLTPILAEAKGWAKVVGVHFHLVPRAADAEALGNAVKAVKRITGLPVTVTLTPDAPARAWKPLAGKVDGALLFSFGRRRETGDRFVPEPSDALVKAFPIPFRLLIVPGGYGFAGKKDEFNGRRIPDGEIDTLSEERNLDFDFGQVLANEPGNVYVFKPRAGSEGRKNSLGADGGWAKFQVLMFGDLIRHLSAAGRWGGGSRIRRVFLIDGLPRDGHLLGFQTLKTILTGRPVEPKLAVEPKPEASGSGWSDFSLRVSFDSPSPTDLSHFNNWIKVRVNGGVFASVRAGDFDRFELLGSDDDARPAPFGRSTVCRLFENIFAPDETNLAGPIRVAGPHPRVFVSYKLTLPDARTITGPEVEVTLRPPTPTPGPAVPKKRRR